jgi:hypothetical protein
VNVDHSHSRAVGALLANIGGAQIELEMKRKRALTILDFLTRADILRAIVIFGNLPLENFASVCSRLIIAPNLERIEKALGRSCDKLQLAYFVQCALMGAHVEVLAAQ